MIQITAPKPIFEALVPKKAIWSLWKLWGRPLCEVFELLEVYSVRLYSFPLSFSFPPSHEVTMRYPKASGLVNQSLSLVSWFLVDTCYGERELARFLCHMILCMNANDMVFPNSTVTHPLTYKYLLRAWRNESITKIQRALGVVGNTDTYNHK